MSPLCCNTTLDVLRWGPCWHILWQTQTHLKAHLHFRAFIRQFGPKWRTVIHTYIHTLIVVAAMQLLTSTSGAGWGSVSCPRTLQHADQGNWTSGLQITKCWLYPWAPSTWPRLISTHTNISLYSILIFYFSVFHSQFIFYCHSGRFVITASRTDKNETNVFMSQQLLWQNGQNLSWSKHYFYFGPVSVATLVMWRGDWGRDQYNLLLCVLLVMAL